jgi:muramoyltetrapeptide carboxypeptidase
MRPRALTPGARVALVAPAGPLDAQRIAAAVERCRALELEPVVFPNASARQGYLAGTDEQRLSDLQTAFDDPGIDAVWALRGGYGTQRIIDGLSLERQRTDPIPFIGFSDNTAVHARHAQLGIVSFHGPHPGQKISTEADAWLRRVLFHAEAAGALPSTIAGPPPRSLVGGVAEGPLAGGNLAILASLCGTRDTLRTDGCILFLEDVGEPTYRIDRTLLQLERAGALAGAAGLAVGRFTECEEDGFAVADVLVTLAERLGVPAVADLPFGHVADNFVVPVGVRARLDADAATLTLVEPAVRSAS